MEERRLVEKVYKQLIGLEILVKAFLNQDVSAKGKMGWTFT